MKLEVARARAKDKVRQLATTSSDHVAFWHASSDLLREVVPFDFHPCWFTVDPANLLLTGHVNRGLEQTPTEIATAWYQEGDVNSPAHLASVEGGVATIRTATDDDPLSSWRWRNLLKPRGFDDSLDAVLRRGGTVWGAVSFLHTEDRRPFTREDLRFVSRISDELALGTQLGMLRAEPSGIASDRPAVLIVTSDLAVTSSSENAPWWLEELPDIGPYARERLPLPAQVIAMRALRSVNGEAGTLLRGRSGTWIRLRGSRISGSTAPAVALVVETARSTELAPIRMAAFGLTPREREVVELVLVGRATREIAAELFISEYTVQDRLKAVFEKVGVRSRRDLVATVHALDYAPRVESNDALNRGGAPIRP